MTTALLAACRVTENEKPKIATNLDERREHMLNLYDKIPDINQEELLKGIKRPGFYRQLLREPWNKKKPYLIIE